MAVTERDDGDKSVPEHTACVPVDGFTVMLGVLLMVTLPELTVPLDQQVPSYARA